MRRTSRDLRRSVDGASGAALLRFASILTLELAWH